VKVAHLVLSFEVGGLERIIANCITSMPSDTEHTVIALRSYSKEFVASIGKDVNVICLDKPAGQSWASFSYLYKILKRVKPDVLHSYNLSTLEYQVIAWLARVKYRLHAEHGRDIWDPEGTNKKYRMLRRIMSRFVHNFVSVSDDLHQWLINDVGINQDKCKLIRNGVDTDSYRREKYRRGDNPERLVFGHVARLQSIKNQQGLLEAYFSIASQNEVFRQNTKLVIVGTGALEESLKRYANEQKDKGTVEFWGERHDMPQVYQSFNVFTMSSHAEGIPMTMLEAMSSELPILSTAVGGIPEITTEEFAELVPSKSVEKLTKGFETVFDKREHFGAMGQKAREQVILNFSQDKMVKDYYSLYEQGLKNVRN
jgi:sugar transferase (PEP-CTERM/EpsH1 system associated)